MLVTSLIVEAIYSHVIDIGGEGVELHWQCGFICIWGGIKSVALSKEKMKNCILCALF